MASYRVAAWQYVIDKFNAENPDIEVVQEAILWSDAMPKMLSATQANTLPDINQVADAQWSTTYLAGALLPVDDIYEEVDAEQKIYPDSGKSYELDGHKWVVPISSNAFTVVYRPSMLQELGYDKFPETWSEFEKYLADVTLDEDGDGVPERYGIALSGARCTEGSDTFLAFLASFNNGIFDQDGNVNFNNPATIRTTDYVANTLMKQYAPPNILSMDPGEMIMNFNSGNAATMIFLFHDLVTAYEEGVKDIALAPVPRPDDASPEDQYALLTNHGLSVTKAAEDPARFEACKRFVKFATQPENTWVLSCAQGSTTRALLP